MENKNLNTKAGIIIVLVITAIVSIFIQAMWTSNMMGRIEWGGLWAKNMAGAPSGVMGIYHSGMMGWMGGAWGGCPMMGWWAWGEINGTNIVEYVEDKTGYEVISVEKYTNGFYVIVGSDGYPLYELLVFPNGVIHPEPQSMMWNGAPMRITEDEARKIAESWLARYFPGAEIKEIYKFPGYYTLHFEINGDMQMLSVNGYNGAVWFHSWHGKYLGEVEH